VLDTQPDTGVVYGDRLEFGRRNGREPVPEFDLPSLLWANTIDACATYRREIWEACGGYDAGARAWEDWDFWISTVERGWRFHRLPDVAFEYRIRPNSMLQNAEREGLRRTVREHIYRKHHQIFEKNLAEILLAGHTCLNAVSGESVKLRESRNHLQHEIELAVADARAVRDSRDKLQRELDLVADDALAVRESRDSLQHDIDLLAATVAAEREALRTSLHELQSELAASRQEIAFMKSTRAWLLRSILVRLKQWLRGK